MDTQEGMRTGPELVDFHSHLIPGVDDGAVDETEAAAALQAFVDQGVRTIIVTPHVQASLGSAALRARLDEIGDRWHALAALVRERFPRLELHRGAEVMLDTPAPDLSDERLRLAGGRFVLVEFPYMSVPPRSVAPLEAIAAAGLVPIIAHPERYTGVTPGSALPAEWRQSGALLQVNTGSLTGRYGAHARYNVLALLEQGLVDYMCSDYHARGRLFTRSARKLLFEMDAGEQADLLTAVNPRRLIAGENPLPVPPLRGQPGIVDRLKQWLQ